MLSNRVFLAHPTFKTLLMQFQLRLLSSLITISLPDSVVEITQSKVTIEMTVKWMKFSDLDDNLMTHDLRTDVAPSDYEEVRYDPQTTLIERLSRQRQSGASSESVQLRIEPRIQSR